MRLLVSGATKTLRQMMEKRPDRFGVLLTPSNGNAEWWDESVTWACDNNCFCGLDVPRYMRLLARVAKFKSRPQWIVCPDVVADAGATWDLFFRWQPILASMNFPVGLVFQDGLERFKWRGPLPSSWKLLTAVFIGGSTEWKMSEHAARLSLEAHEQGKIVHWGRVNSRRRIRHLANQHMAGRLWIDTMDGSGWSQFSEIRLPLFVRWADGAYRQRQPNFLDTQ